MLSTALERLQDDGELEEGEAAGEEMEDEAYLLRAVEVGEAARRAQLAAARREWDSVSTGDDISTHYGGQGGGGGGGGGGGQGGAAAEARRLEALDEEVIVLVVAVVAVVVVTPRGAH